MSRCKRAVLVVFAALFALSPVSAFADTNNSSADLRGLLREASEAAVISRAMKGCVDAIADKDDSRWGVLGKGVLVYGRDGKEVSGGDIFDDSIGLISDGTFHPWTDSAVPLWLEEKINGGDDGILWCSDGKGNNNILHQFSGITGYDIGDLVCSKFDKGRPGLMAATVWPVSWKQLDYDCNPSNNRRYVRSDNAADYFKRVYDSWYNEKSSTNPYLLSYGQLDNLSNFVLYDSYLRDFENYCVKGQSPYSTKDSSAISFYEPIKTFSTNGGTLVISEEKFAVETNKTWTKSLVKSGPTDCKALSKGIKELGGEVENDLMIKMRDRCGERVNSSEGEARIEELEAAIDNPELTDESREEARKQLDEIRTARSDTVYLYNEQDPNDEDVQAYRCVLDRDVDFTNRQNDDLNASEKTCSNSGAFGSMGWALCPTIENTGNIATGLYDDYIEPLLQTKASLFADSNNGVRGGWEYFRTFANIVFSILLLFVIFSQLTGYGIDNYGIKKILPKLIIVAILVNLSYLICVLCVDLSNIVGSGIQNLFQSLGTGYSAAELWKRYGMEGTLVGGTIVVALVGVILVKLWVVFSGPQLLAAAAALGVAVLSVVIALFFLFLLLAAREAGVIVLTVLSPLAFACYALPNTKFLFDRWRKIGSGLLLLYPICGFLVGGGEYVSRLLLSSLGSADMGKDLPLLFMAILVGIVPIFFIPKLLKSSMAGLGNIGTKISDFGKNVRGSVQQKAKGSEAYKNIQQLGMENKMRRMSGVDKNGNLTKWGEKRNRIAQSKFGKTLGMDRALARNVSRIKKAEGEDEAANAFLTGMQARTGISDAQAIGGLGRDFDSGTEGAFYGGKFLDAAKRGDTLQMNAMLQAMKSSNIQPKNVAKLVRHALNGGYLNGMSKNDRANWLGETFTKFGNDFLSTDAELAHLMSHRGAGLNGDSGMKGIGGYGEYANKSMGIDDLKPEDIPKLSGDSIAGLAAAGILNQALAQRVLASNPNISADKKIMLGAIASGAAKVNEQNVAQFKEDAEKLMKDPGANVDTISGANADMVSAWASNTPQQVVVVGGGKQINPGGIGNTSGGAGGNVGGGAGGSNSGNVQEGTSFDVHGGKSGGSAAGGRRIIVDDANGTLLNEHLKNQNKKF